MIETLPNDALVVVINHGNALPPHKTTTAIVALASERRPTWVVGAADLALDDDGPFGVMRAVIGHRTVPRPDNPADVFVDLGPPTPCRLTPPVPVMVRTNPAYGITPPIWKHALRVLAVAQERGVAVINPAGALRTFATKTGLLQLPAEIRPSTLVCARTDTAMQRLRSMGRAVVKPVGGSQGSGVFITHPDDPNQRTAVELLLTHGPVVVQSWIDGAEGGDVRMFLIDGEPLYLHGRPVTIARVPTGSELRSNVHLGAEPRTAELTPELLRIAELAGPVLRDHGVRIAGLDCIAGKVVEVNVCSPGGLTDLSELAGFDATSAFVDHVARHLWTP